MVRGQTYIFGNESGSHPFQIQSTSGIGGTAYNDGVTDNNTIGDVILTVPYDAPDTLYYQCTSHSPMNGTINVASKPELRAKLEQLSDVVNMVTYRYVKNGLNSSTPATPNRATLGPGMATCTSTTSMRMA